MKLNYGVFGRTIQIGGVIYQPEVLDGEWVCLKFWNGSRLKKREVIGSVNAPAKAKDRTELAVKLWLGYEG